MTTISHVSGRRMVGFYAAGVVGKYVRKHCKTDTTGDVFIQDGEFWPVRWGHDYRVGHLWLAKNLPEPDRTIYLLGL